LGWQPHEPHKKGKEAGTPELQITPGKDSPSD